MTNGCTNRMTNNASNFKELDNTCMYIVIIGIEKHVVVEVKWVISFVTILGTKHILDVLFVLELSQNLLSQNYCVWEGWYKK